MAEKQSSFLSFFAGILAAAAFILGILGVFLCDFIKFLAQDDTGNTFHLKFGIYFYQAWTIGSSSSGPIIMETCHSYPESVSPDPAWKSAAAFGTIAVILGGCFAIMNAVLACVNPVGRRTTSSEGGAYLICCLCQGLSLILLKSKLCTANLLVENAQAPLGMEFEDTCVMGRGAKYVISATVFWFLAGVVALQANRAEKKEVEMALNDNTVSLTDPILPPEEQT